jgi:hypothetical protein
MTLISIGNSWSFDPATDTFKKFIAACLVAAKDILAEPSNTSNHANRVIWAQGLQGETDELVFKRVHRIIRLAISSNAVFQADPTGLTDNDIQFIVNSFIDVVATGA